MSIREILKSENEEDLVLLAQVLCNNHNIHRVGAFMNKSKHFNCSVTGKKLLFPKKLNFKWGVYGDPFDMWMTGLPYVKNPTKTSMIDNMKPAQLAYNTVINQLCDLKSRSNASNKD